MDRLTTGSVPAQRYIAREMSKEANEKAIDALKNIHSETERAQPLICQICTLLFTKKRRSPRVLKCGHTLCFACILQLFRHKRENMQKRLPKKQIVPIDPPKIPISCPFCRDITVFTVVNNAACLPKNAKIMKLLGL